MSIVPVEFERACERRWVAKSLQALDRSPHTSERSDQDEAGELSAPKLETKAGT
jgi:hypothetical protein